MKNNDVPAFPCEGEGFGMPEHFQPGMTLRDYFAGQVLIGLVYGSFTHLGQDCLREARDQGFAKGAGGVFAKSAYEYADAMLAEREEE